MPKFNVHVYEVVRVKVRDVEAADHREAMQKATEISARCREALFSYGPFARDEIAATEPAEDVAYYLVDEVGDDEYERSRWYNGNMSPGEMEPNTLPLPAAAHPHPETGR